jgi:UDP-perosamine 4-acetyltransferase
LINKYIVIGAGGHARVVIEALRSSNAELVGVLDINPKLKGTSIDGVEVLGGDELLAKFAPGSVALANGVGGIRSTEARQAVFERLVAKGQLFPAVKSATAVVSDHATLAAGCQILTRAVVHPGAKIGANAVVNTGAIVEHDAWVGPNAFVGPGAILCGDVRVAESAYIGAGAVVLPGVKLGAGAMVAAGATAHKDVPEGGQMIGARLVRRPA